MVFPIQDMPERRPHCLTKRKTPPSKTEERRFEFGGRLACKTARGTVIFCLPADRPHDPGDAADL